MLALPLSGGAGPKGGQMAIGDASVSERFWKRTGVELRVGPRARDRTYVDEQIHGHLPE